VWPAPNHPWFAPCLIPGCNARVLASPAGLCCDIDAPTTPTLMNTEAPLQVPKSAVALLTVWVVLVGWIGLRGDGGLGSRTSVERVHRVHRSASQPATDLAADLRQSHRAGSRPPESQVPAWTRGKAVPCAGRCSHNYSASRRASTCDDAFFVACQPDLGASRWSRACFFITSSASR